MKKWFGILMVVAIIGMAVYAFIPPVSAEKGYATGMSQYEAQIKLIDWITDNCDPDIADLYINCEKVDEYRYCTGLLDYDYFMARTDYKYQECTVECWRQVALREAFDEGVYVDIEVFQVGKIDDEISVYKVIAVGSNSEDYENGEAIFIIYRNEEN